MTTPPPESPFAYRPGITPTFTKPTDGPTMIGPPATAPRPEDASDPFFSWDVRAARDRPRFFADLAERYGDRSFTAVSILDDGVQPPLECRDRKSTVKSLGVFLAKREGLWISGYRLWGMGIEGHSKRRLWRIEVKPAE